MPRTLLNEHAVGGIGACFDEHFADARDRRRAVLRAVRPLTPVVADTLDRQNARLAASPARDLNLAALRRGAAAVVTGQQVGLFLGPLYTLYKAASAVVVARALAAESKQPVVPVFWLQTEDHDLPEIARCHAPCATGASLTLTVRSSAADRVSIAHRVLPPEVTTCLAQLRSELANLPYAEEHLARLERNYEAGASWAQAFATTLSEFFVEEGLVFLDPRDADLAPPAALIHRRALTQAAQISHALRERSDALRSTGIAEAVHVRNGAPLSFFHPGGVDGPRYRLEPAVNGFSEVGGERCHSLDELLATLDSEPLRFSTSALLRPILQDTLLPTAACVVGPGEIAYLAQLAPLYAAYGMTPPLVVPRAHMRILEEATVRRLRRLDLRADEVRSSEDETLAACASREGSPCDVAPARGFLLEPFEDALGDLRERLKQLGSEVDAAFEKTRRAVHRAVNKLAERVERASLHRDLSVVEDVRLLQMRLYPGGVPQERFFGVSYFAARYGERRFVESVLAAIVPFDPTPRDLLCEDLQTRRAID